MATQVRVLKFRADKVPADSGRHRTKKRMARRSDRVFAGSSLAVKNGDATRLWSTAV